MTANTVIWNCNNISQY